MKEFYKLVDKVKKVGIKYQVINIPELGGKMLNIFRNDEQNRCCNVSAHIAAYGYNEGLVEFWNYSEDPKGFLTSEQAYNLILEELMHKYTVTITEILTREVEVEAKDRYEAKDIVRKQYEAGDIVLDSSDFCHNEFEVN